MARQEQYEVYPDTENQYRWRLRGRNNKIKATSGEAFDSKGNASRAAKNVRGLNKRIPVVVFPLMVGLR